MLTLNSLMKKSVRTLHHASCGPRGGEEAFSLVELLGPGAMHSRNAAFGFMLRWEPNTA